MHKTIHITDTHIVAPGGSVVGHDPTPRLESVIAAINQTHRDAALCVFSGDLTDHGDEAAYRELAVLLADLEVPYRLMMGNHDHRATFRRAFPDQPVDDFGYVQSSLDLGDARLIFIDTLDDDRPDTGRLCQNRMEWLRNALTAPGAKQSVVFMHHPPFSVGVPCFDVMMLNNPEPFQALIRDSGAVAHLAFGHLHLTTSGSWNGIPFSCNRGTCHRIALSFADGAVEYVGSEPTYDVLILSDTGVTVHHTAPFTKDSVIAREYATPDGVGRLEFAGDVATKGVVAQ
ncbi:MAG: phosphodiesterase [Paracoccaceae bacterium]